MPRAVTESTSQSNMSPIQTERPIEPVEKAGAEELRTLQTKRLQWSLRHTYDHVPHYQQKFHAAGVTANDLRQLTDLQRFPFTTKDDFRENYPCGLFAVPRNKIVRMHPSSGTTGKPTVVGYTRNDIDVWAHLMARSIRAAGGRPGQTALVSYGYGLFTGGLGAHYGAERLGCGVIPMSGGQTEKQVQMINDLRPEIILVTPSYMLTIADEFERQGLDPAKSSLKIGIFGGEPWTEALSPEIESRCAIDAVDIYGLSEVMGPGVACECAETKDCLGIWEGAWKCARRETWRNKAGSRANCSFKSRPGSESLALRPCCLRAGLNESSWEKQSV